MVLQTLTINTPNGVFYAGSLNFINNNVIGNKNLKKIPELIFRCSDGI